MQSEMHISIQGITWIKSLKLVSTMSFIIDKIKFNIMENRISKSLGRIEEFMV